MKVLNQTVNKRMDMLETKTDMILNLLQNLVEKGVANTPVPQHESYKHSENLKTQEKTYKQDNSVQNQPDMFIPSIDIENMNIKTKSKTETSSESLNEIAEKMKSVMKDNNGK